jgi:hypothetical protein
MLFYRDFLGFAGGHLKLWHYFQHVRAHGAYRPRIYFTPASVWDESNPWREERAAVEPHWQPQSAGCLFLAGLDWQALPESALRPEVPVINLVQGVRHAQPGDPRYAYLGRKAIRICVSAEVARAVSASGRANGPVVTIANGIDLGEVGARRAPQSRSIELLIVGPKQPELARRLAAALPASAGIVLIDQVLPRAELLARLGEARVALLLPLEAEGFYLPALEAMAAGALVVCPDCVGNRVFCVGGDNCLMPDYTEAALLAATRRALQLDGAEAGRLLERAGATARRHTLEAERSEFHALLNHLRELW